MKKHVLRMGRKLSFPSDAVTQTFGFVARKGGGKTYAAQKLAEQMLEQRAQVIALDPIGNWWALRLAADGKRPGFDIPVFGGLHGDLPLHARAGQVVANSLVDTDSSAVVDVSQFRKNERRQFVAEFCEQLFARRKADPAAMHLFIEEAQVFAPQRLANDEARMLGAVEDIVRLGRNFGIGSSLITQRPQSVNKEVLNQVECLFMFQINGAHERRAVLDWVTYKGIDVQSLVDELPSLPVGTAYVWSPQWLGILDAVAIGEKRTYDASATPKVGARHRTKRLKPLDLEVIERAMQSVIDEQAANDPKKLRAKVDQLEKQLERRGSSDDKAVAALESELAGAREEIAALRLQLEDSATRSATVIQMLDGAKDTLKTSRVRPNRRVRLVVDAPPRGWRPTTVTPKAVVSRSAKAPSPRYSGPSTLGFSKTSGQYRILVVLAQFHPKPCTDRKIGILARLATGAGTFSTYLGRLRKQGLVEGPRHALTITDAGLAGLGSSWEPLPTGDELRSYWIGYLKGGKRRILEVLMAAYPSFLGRDELAEQADLTANAGTFSTYLGKLRKLDLLEGDATGFRAASDLFDD